MNSTAVQLLSRNYALWGLCDVAWGLVPPDLCFTAHILRSGVGERGKKHSLIYGKFVQKVAIQSYGWKTLLLLILRNVGPLN